MIYTSRFQNPALKSGNYTVVGIVRGLPRFRLGYKLAGNIIDIAPTREIFHINDREEFTVPYKQHLDDVGFERISAQLQKYVDIGKDVVLCCYEDVRIPNEWCHRLVFAEWWKEKTGESISELPFEPQIASEPNVQRSQPISDTDKPLIKVIYSLWTDTVNGELVYQGNDMYYLVNRETGKLSIMANAKARELISSGMADVWLDYDSIEKIRFVLPKVPVGKAYIADKKGREKEIDLKNALRLIEEGKAVVRDIEVEK